MHARSLRRLIVLALVLVLAGGVGCGGDADGTSETSSFVAWLAAGTDTREGVLLRSDDGANTWSVVLRAPVGAIAFADHDRGSAVGFGVFRTTDGGASWDQSPFPLGPRRGFFDVAFAGERGVAVGEEFPLQNLFHSIAWYTQDGGATWNPSQGTTLTDDSFLDSACILATGTALAVGSGGFNEVTHSAFVFASQDAGKTWSEISTRLRNDENAFFPYGTFQGVTCVDPDTLWIVGQDRCLPFFPFCGHDESLLVLRSSTRGRSWEDLSARAQRAVGPGESILNAVSFVDAARGWAVGSTGDAYHGQEHALVLRTTDRGANWTRQSLPGDPAGELDAVAFADPRTGIAIGHAFDSPPFAFITHDGGHTWKPLALPADLTRLNDVTLERRR